MSQQCEKEDLNDPMLLFVKDWLHKSSNALPNPWQKSHLDKELCLRTLSLLWRLSRPDRRDLVASQLEGRNETPDLDMVFLAMLGCL